VEYFVNFFITPALGFCQLAVYTFQPEVINANYNAKCEMTLGLYMALWILKFHIFFPKYILPPSYNISLLNKC